MSLVGKYKTYRKAQVNLNVIIINTCLGPDILIKAARLLGIARGPKGDTIILDDEMHADILMDFAIHECISGSMSVAGAYREKVGRQTVIQQEVLESLLSAYTSLFRIVSIDKSRYIITLHDVLNDKSDLELVDVGFSGTAMPGQLMFTRLIGFKDFSMTSGVSFAFTADKEGYVLNHYKKLARKVDSNNESLKRFVAFYKLSKICGCKTRFQTVGRK